MTALTDRTDPRWTPAQLEHLAEFESAATPPEIVETRVVEEVARALSRAEYPANPWDLQSDGWREHRRRLAVAAVAAYRAAQDGGAEEAVRDDREPKVCPRCGQTCTYDGWGHVHKSGIGIGSCPPQADR